MQTTKTEQLVKALALDFIHNKTLNISILQLLCAQQKIHASTTSDQIITKINIIDKGFQLLKQHQTSKKDKQKGKRNFMTENPIQRNFYNMVSIFIFNVSAINEHYINQIEKQMVQSTASQSATVDLNRTFYKDKMAINILKQHLQTYFVLLTEKSQFLQSIINEILNNSQRKITESELGLLQTLDYLCVKYSISNDTATKIVKILEKNENALEQNSSLLIKADSIKEVNKLVFSQARQAQLYQILETNSSINFKNILSIINANYLNTNPPRKIFNTAELSGKQTIEGIIVRIVKRIGKNELFNQKNQDYTPFRLLIFYFLNKHFSVYMEFNQIVKSLMNNLQLSSQAKLNSLKKIQRIFRIFISIENPHFHQIIQFTYNLLVSKYSEPAAIELIKKLLLNRFLLNPSFYVLYNEPDQEDIKQYVEAANIVRALFYPNKTQELSQKTKSPQFLKISSEILYSLEYCLKKEKDSKLIIQNSNFLYVNDKILKGQMQQLYDELKQSHHSPRQGTKQAVHLPNMVSDYSLSFSLVKNNPTINNLSHPLIQNLSEVKLAMNTNRSNANLKDNQSIRYMYQQLKGQKSQNQIPPRSPQKKLKLNTKTENKEQKQLQQKDPGFGRVSQLARKQHELSNETRLNSMRLPTDRQIIEQLVEMRKQYGELKRCLKKQCEARKFRNNKKISNLLSFSARFNQVKEEIQKENNTLYIHMTTIA